MSKTGHRFGLTVGAKLTGLIAVLLMSSLASLVWLSTRLFIEDNTALIQQMNSDTAANQATQMRGLIATLAERMRILGTVITQNFQHNEIRQGIIDEFFLGDKEFLAVFVHKINPDRTMTHLGRAVSPEMEALKDSNGDRALASLLSRKSLSVGQVIQGGAQISIIKLTDESAAVALTIPLLDSGNQSSIALSSIVRQSKFIKAFSDRDLVTSFMVDHQGRLIAHSDPARAAAAENVSHLGAVSQLLSGKFGNNGQTRYIDPQTGEARLSAFYTVGFAGLGVVAEVAESAAFSAAKKVEYRSILFALVVLSISFLAGYLYSGTITWPIRQLVEAAHRISEGDFKITLKPKGRDEVARLSLAFNDMAKGLEERDRVKETFNKFHNKEIADKLLSGEVKLGGERKEATIFFSDVRGFTAMSESMEPEQVVEMLNEYMTRMVAIIRSHGGIVDKYVGDAIMALWGVPISGSDDAYNAVRACLAMRKELAALNELRISRKQSPLKIGMGLNTGQVIAGNIGSDEKMEYTVIGDSVNLASRIESMTKEYGTDLLLSKNVYEQLQNRFVFETCKSAKVKGKSSAIEVYKVQGYLDESGKPVVIETPYSSYAAEKSEKVVHEEPTAWAMLESTGLIQRPEVLTEMPTESAAPVPPPFHAEMQVVPPNEPALEQLTSVDLSSATLPTGKEFTGLIERPAASDPTPSRELTATVVLAPPPLPDEMASAQEMPPIIIAPPLSEPQTRTTGPIIRRVITPPPFKKPEEKKKAA